jgi:hypothetical protein
MTTVLTFNDLEKIQALNHRQNNDGVDFGFHTCCDYVDSLVTEGDKSGVVVFVEPLGNITKWGESFTWVLDWWITVFEAQPAVWDYIDAGHWLKDLYEDDNLSDDPGKVWPVDPKPSGVKPALEQAISSFTAPPVSFSPEQRQQIEEMINQENKVEAQRLILDLLDKEISNKGD